MSTANQKTKVLLKYHDDCEGEILVIPNNELKLYLKIANIVNNNKTTNKYDYFYKLIYNKLVLFENYIVDGDKLEKAFKELPILDING